MDHPYGSSTSSTTEKTSFPDPDRTIETYAGTLGLQASIKSFSAAARQQTKGNFRKELTTGMLNDYIRSGFDMELIPFYEDQKWQNLDVIIASILISAGFFVMFVIVVMVILCVTFKKKDVKKGWKSVKK